MSSSLCRFPLHIKTIANANILPKNYAFLFARTHKLIAAVADTSSGCGRTAFCTASAAGSNVFHKYKEVMDVPEELFKGASDRFNGITVDSGAEGDGCADFLEKLRKSLDYWTTNKRRGIWFKVHTKHSDWVPHLAKEGFEFHHAKEGFVVMYKWLPTHEAVNIPVYAHTMMGVGGLVVNEKNEVLVVSDRYAMIKDSWKLPGGYVEPGENLVDAAIREVREETGIESQFETVISMRHSHGGGYNCSDMYVVIALRPTTSELTRCEREIARVQWMPIDEYLGHPHVHETNRHFMQTFLDYKSTGVRFDVEMKTHPVLKKEYCMYFVKKDL